MLWVSAEVAIFTGYIKIKRRVRVGEAIGSSNEEKKDLTWIFLLILFFLKKPEWFSTWSRVSLRLHSQLERAMLRTIVPIIIVPVDRAMMGYVMFSTLGGNTSLFRGFLRPLLPVDTLCHMINKRGQAADHFPNKMMDNCMAVFNRTKFQHYYLCRQDARYPYWLTWFRRLTPIICVSYSGGTDNSRLDWGNNSIIGVSCKDAGCHCPLTSWLPFCSSISYRRSLIHNSLLHSPKWNEVNFNNYHNVDCSYLLIKLY